MSIPGYRDADSQMEECTKKAKEIEERRSRAAEAARQQRLEKERKAEEERQEAQRRAEQERIRQDQIQRQKQLEEEQKRKKQARTKAIAVLSVLVLIVLIVVYVTMLDPMIKYNNTFNTAKQQVSDGKYWDALKTLETIKEGHPEVEQYVQSSSELQGELARIAKYDEGNTMMFGNYEQDNDLSNGKEPIKWLIVSEDENRRLLVSEKVLDYQQFNTEEIHSTRFSGSYLQHWLQNDFLNAAFSESEKKYVSSITLLSDYSYSQPSKETIGRLTAGQKKAEPTEYAKALGSDGTWFLSSVGHFLLRVSSYQYSAVMTTYGSVDEYGPPIWDMQDSKLPYRIEKSGVRPAIWIDISKPID